MDDITASDSPGTTAPKGQADVAPGRQNSKSGKKRAAYLSAHDRRFALIRAAHKLLETTPASSITPALVCKQAGCVRSLFYRYFTDIPDMLKVLTDYLVTASVWKYTDWNDKKADDRVTVRSTLESVSRLFITLVEPVQALYQAGNSGIVLDYIDGCQNQIAPGLLEDFVEGVGTGHRLDADGLEETWSIFFTGLLVHLVQDERMGVSDVRTLLARAFHIEALLNMW